MKHVKGVALLVMLLILLASCYPPSLLPPDAERPLLTPEAGQFLLAAEAEQPITARVAPLSILVRYREDTSPEKRSEARAVANGKLDREYKLVPGLEKLTVADTPAAIQALRRQPSVLYAEPDYVVSIEDPYTLLSGSPRDANVGTVAAVAPDTIPNDPRFSELWGMANIKAPLAWDVTTGKSDFVVAIIDTGIDYTHPDLLANVWTNPFETPANGIDDDSNGYVDDVHGYDFVNNDADPMDDYFHGTHLAGTIGAVGNNGTGVAGVNWSVKLMALKFLNASGSGAISAAISALEYATKMGARVSNNSWGGSGYSQALYDAIRASQASGHLFVAAAGNSSMNADFTPTYPGAYDLDNIICVAATDSADQLASFSNYGVRSVDLGAPGVGILSTALGGGYASYNGTSMAVPHVTGTAALVWGLHTDWSYARVRDQILATARAVPALSGRTLTGGVVNAGDAVSNDNPGPVPTPGPTPIPPTPEPPPPFYSYAVAQFPVEGRVRGSYQDTWGNDTAAETITERATSGAPTTRIDQLEHIWQFYVPSGRPQIVFRIDAWTPSSQDSDQMLFEYSTNRADWTPMFGLAQTTQSDKYQEFALPDSVAGQDVYIRVTDSDRTMGSWKAADSVYVDHMHIRSTAR